MTELRCTSAKCGFTYTAEDAVADAQAVLADADGRASIKTLGKIVTMTEARIAHGAMAATLRQHLADNPTHVVEATWRPL